MESNNTIGARISVIRKEKNLTMEELAEIAGTTKGTVSRWESGEIKTLRVDKIKKIADALGYNPMWIMGFDAAKYPLSEESVKKIDIIYNELMKMKEEDIDKVLLIVQKII